MPRWKCNSCGGTYDDVLLDGMAYYHACPPEEITPAIFDAAGKVVEKEVRKARADIRDERPQPDQVYVDGKCFRPVPNPEERNKFLLAECTPAIVSEGKGRTKLE